MAYTSKKKKEDINSPESESQDTAVSATEPILDPEPMEPAKPEPKAEPKPSKAKVKSDKYITVKSVKGDQHEPFQHIRLPQGEPKPVQNTDWVKCQIKAGVLVEV